MRFRLADRALGYIAIGACAFIFACVYVAPGSVATAAGRSECAKADITTALVRKIFGASASIAGSVYVSEQGRCAIACTDTPATCTTTVAELERAKYFKAEIASDIQYLDESGRAHRQSVTGAGAGAVLLTANHYGDTADPNLVFKAGPYAITIGPAYGGQSETAAVYRQWEKLARAVHSRLH